MYRNLVTLSTSDIIASFMTEISNLDILLDKSASDTFTIQDLDTYYYEIIKINLNNKNMLLSKGHTMKCYSTVAYLVQLPRWRVVQRILSTTTTFTY